MAGFKEQNWPSGETGESVWMKKGGVSKLGCGRLHTAWTTGHPTTTIQEDDAHTPFIAERLWEDTAKAVGQGREQRSSPPSALTPKEPRP